jgi:hypothetical protein
MAERKKTVAESKTTSAQKRRTLILWALLARENAAAFQKELKPEPDKADRVALVAEGLIKEERRGRSRPIWIEVTDEGWKWAGKNLDAALPANSSASGQILQAWLTRLKAFMDARGVVLADVLGPQVHAQADAVGPGGAESSMTAPPSYAALRQRIRTAYLEVTGNRLNTRALLSDLREKLEGIDRATLDEALKRMHLEDGTTLSGINNPQEITQAIRDAELNFKGESMYVLWITK